MDETHITERDIADAAWSRALLFRVVRLALLRIAFDAVQAAKALKP